MAQYRQAMPELGWSSPSTTARHAAFEERLTATPVEAIE